MHSDDTRKTTEELHMHSDDITPTSEQQDEQGTPKEKVNHVSGKRNRQEKGTRQPGTKTGETREPMPRYEETATGGLKPVEPTPYTPPEARENDVALDVSKNIYQKDFAIQHMIEVRNWKPEWLDTYGIRYLTYEEATTAPYSYSKLYTSPWGGMHFPAGRVEPARYWGQLYNWYPCNKSRKEHERNIKNIDSSSKIGKYITSSDFTKEGGLVLDPAKYLNHKTEEPIAGIAEDLQGVYKAHATWGARFIHSTRGCWSVTTAEVQEKINKKRLSTGINKVTGGRRTDFIYDNDVLNNFSVFHAAVRGYLYGNLSIKILSSEPSKKVGLDEFVDSGKTLEEFKSILAYDYDSFLTENTFNFTKNKYSPYGLFREVKHGPDGATNLEQMYKVYFKIHNPSCTLSFDQYELIKNRVKEIETKIFELPDPLNTLYKNGNGPNNILGLCKETETYRTIKLNVGSLNAELNRLFNFIEIKRDKNNDVMPVPWECGNEVANRMLDSLENNMIKTLKQIKTIPLIKRNGRLIESTAYEAESETLVIWNTVHTPMIKGDKESAKGSIQRIKHLLREFEFKTESDVSSAIAMFLTGVSRHLYDLAPCFVVHAHTPGSGKGTLMVMFSHIITGKNPEYTSYANSEELNKSLLPVVLGSPQLVNIDNAEGLISNSTLESMFTSGYLALRTLGESTYNRVPAKQTWTINGNQLTFSTDFHRRMCVINMDKTYVGNKNYEVTHLESELKEERIEILYALFDILKAFFQRDCSEDPEWPAPLASFGEWDSIVRRCLLWLGEEDPLKSKEVLLEQDEARNQDKNLFALWYKVFGNKPVTAKTICSMFKMNALGLKEEKEELIDECERKGIPLDEPALEKWEAEKLTDRADFLDVVKSIKHMHDSDTQSLNPRNLGRYLSKQNGLHIGAYSFSRSKETVDNASQWIVTIKE